MFREPRSCSAMQHIQAASHSGGKRTQGPCRTRLCSGAGARGLRRGLAYLTDTQIHFKCAYIFRSFQRR